MEAIAAADTGPLIALAKADRLSLLQHVLGKVLIGPTVERELLARPTGDAHRLEAAIGDLLVRAPAEPVPAPVASLLRTVDAGEAEAIGLAYTRSISLLIDERRGTEIAIRLGIATFGTAALFIRAKNLGLVDSVVPILLSMRAQGYWLSSRVIADVARVVHEPLP